MRVSAAGLRRSSEWRYRLSMPKREPVPIQAEEAPKNSMEVVVFDASKEDANLDKELVHE